MTVDSDTRASERLGDRIHPNLEAQRSGRSKRPLPRRNDLAVRSLLVSADLVAILVAFALGRAAAAEGDAGSWSLPVLAVSLPCWLFALKSIGMYDRESDVVGHSVFDEVAPLARLATAGTWLIVAADWLITERASIASAIVFWLSLVVLFPILRSLVRPIFRSAESFPQNTVIVGAGNVGQLIARKLLVHPEYHINLLGFVDSMPKERRDDLYELTLLGSQSDLAEIVVEHQVERVVIAFSNDSHEPTMNLIRQVKDLDVRVDIVPRLFDIIPPHLMSNTVEGIPLISLPRLRLSLWSRTLKRSFDVVIASLVTIAILPTFVLAALAIKVDSRGPILFRQMRMGAGGRPFWIYKFRTMVPEADDLKDEIAHLNVHAVPGGDPRMFKVASDPRVTRIGRLLRRYSLDEFPQLINVLKGDMSLIGPRPLILEEDQHVESWGRKRLMLKPGMTGLWQVSGRTTIPFEDMVKLDYMYVTTWSITTDCKLLLQTFPLVMRGDRSGHE